jgi:hypothetical protein
MTFKLEYLGKFKFILKKNSGSDSGDKAGSTDEKSRARKSHENIPLSETLHRNRG